MPQLLRYVFVCVVLSAGFAFAFPFRKIADESNNSGSKDEPKAEVLVLRTDVEPAMQRPQPVRDSSRSAVKMLDIVASENIISNTASRPSVPMERSVESSDLDTGKDEIRSLPSISESAQSLPSITEYQTQRKAKRRSHNVVKLKRKTIERFTTHRIVDGDELKELAANYLGNADRHLEIFELNRDVIKHPDVLPLHTEIRIPVN